MIILIDCPPSLNLLTIMALVASDALVVPLQTNFLPEGLTNCETTRDKIKFESIIGDKRILLTMFDREQAFRSS